MNLTFRLDFRFFYASVVDELYLSFALEQMHFVSAFWELRFLFAANLTFIYGAYFPGQIIFNFS